MTDKIKVVLSFIAFPWTMAHFYWRALERREDVELFTVGPYSGDFIPWDGGMRVPTKYVKTPNLPLQQEFASNSNLTSTFVELRLPWEPDLWIQADAGWHFANRPKAKKVVHIQTDPHVLKETYREPKAYSDVSFCMQSAYLEPNEVYLPYACDPTLHYPMEVRKERDGCLIGLHYEQRDRLVNSLRSLGYDIYYSIGQIYDEFRLEYNRSRIALSWSSLNDTPSRVFEAMAMGVPLLANRTPDLCALFTEGKHFIGFDTLDEAVVKFQEMMGDMGLRAHLAAAAEQAVLEKHTWDHRIKTILETVGLI